MLLSIIVPVYQAEKSIRRLIDPILRIKRDDFQILMIDDGSTDSSASICDGYAKKDSRCSVYHVSNGGVSRARNIGIEHASGEYLYFCDSDDCVYPDMLEKAIRLTETHNAELYIFDFESYDIPSGTLNHSNYKLPPKVMLNKSSIKEGMIKPLVLQTNTNMPQVWNKFFQRKLIREHDIHFEEGVYKGEDWRFVLDFLAVSDCAYYEPLLIYRYILDGSQTETKYKKAKGLQCLGGIKRKLYFNRILSLQASNDTMRLWYAALITEVKNLAASEINHTIWESSVSDWAVKDAVMEMSRLNNEEYYRLEISRKVKLYSILIRFRAYRAFKCLCRVLK